MNTPNLNWINALNQAPLSTLAGIAIAMAILRWLDYTQAWIVPTGIITGALVLAKAIEHFLKEQRKNRKHRIKRKFRHLDLEQREFLRERYSSGTSHFSLDNSGSTPRWFEELQEWNYVRYIRPIILSNVSDYRITSQGWNEIKRNRGRSD